jgi:hypothetical protein
MHKSFDQIYKAYKKLIGDEFIYISKYGGHLRARIEDVQLVTESVMDPRTAFVIQTKFADKRGLESPKLTTYKGPAYVAFRPQIYLVTDKGNQYEIEKCYIIGKEIN